MDEKTAFLLLCLLLLCFCSSPPGQIDKISEDGVEVILNYREPYILADEPQNLSLEPLFSIDTEDDIFLDKGLTDIKTFDVNWGSGLEL